MRSPFQQANSLLYLISFPLLIVWLLYLLYHPAVTTTTPLPQQYLLPAYIHEQESKSQIHLVRIAQMVHEFNNWNEKLKTRRQIVLLLPNVGGSRISSCSFKPYSYYYGDFPVPGVSLLQEFYTPESDARSQVITLFPDFSKLAANTTRPMCMDGTDKYHVPQKEIPTHAQMPTAFETKLNLKKISQVPDILLIDWHLPSSDVGVPMIPYNPSWEQMAVDTVGNEKYIGVHWRMEGVTNPVTLRECAHKLLKVVSLYPNVYIATDFPLQGHQRSGTFHGVNLYHQEAIEILRTSPNIRLSNISVADTGALGIVDKIILSNAQRFYRNDRKCGRHSSFALQVSKMRKERRKVHIQQLWDM